MYIYIYISSQERHHIVYYSFKQSIGIRPQFRLLEKKYPRLCAHKRTWCVLIGCYSHKILESKPNIALIYHKSYAECRDSVFDWQIND